MANYPKAVRFYSGESLAFLPCGRIHGSVRAVDASADVFGKGGMRVLSQLDDSMALDNPLESYLKQPQGFKIYTHAVRTRMLILTMFGAYLVLFALFIRFLRRQYLGYEQFFEALAASGDSGASQWLFLLISGGGLIIGTLFFVYLMWSVIDIWGLQVWVSPLEIRVQNTIIGPGFRKWTGVGRMNMDDIEALEGSRGATYVIGKTKRLRFSPVDKVDKLIKDILTHGNDIEIR